MQEKTVAAAPSIPRLPLPVIIGVFVLLAASLGFTISGDAEWWKVVLLGIVQGITEWLPISSTAHLILTADLIGFKNSVGGTFEIFIQLGTVLSVVGFYLADLLSQARAFFGQGRPEEIASARRLWIGVLIAFVPAAVIGVLFRDFIKLVLFDSPLLIASTLIVGGVILIAIERLPRPAAGLTSMERISWRQALGVGIAQIFALVPGVSRSGSTIVGGLLAGLDRRSATAFAFYLSIPTLGMATLYDLYKSLDQIQPDDWGRLLLGALVAMIVGWICIGWLLRYISRHSFLAFGIYRIVAGVVILLMLAAGRL